MNTLLRLRRYAMKTFWGSAVLCILLAVMPHYAAGDSGATPDNGIDALFAATHGIFTVAGTQHPDRMEVIRNLKPGDHIILHRAYGNVYDANAIDVRDMNNRKFGHLLEKDCEILAPAWEAGAFQAEIESVKQIEDLPGGADRPQVSVKLTYTPGVKDNPRLNTARSIRIGYPTADRDPYVALEAQLGYFAEEFARAGVSVQLIGLKAGGDIIAAAVKGDIDVSLGFGDTPFITAAAQGRPILAIARGKDVKGYFTVVTLADSGITSLAELRGKRVATVPGTKTYDFMLRALESAGLSLDDITFTATPDKDATLQALRDRTADAIMMTEPMISRYLSDPGLRFLSEADDLKKDLNNLIASTSFAWSNPELVARFLKVVLRYNDFINADRAATCSYVNDYFKVGYSLDRFVNNCRYDPRWTPEIVGEYEKSRDVMLKTGALKESFDISRFFNNYFLDLAAKLK